MKSFCFERLPSPPRNIGRLGFVTQLRFSSSEVCTLYLRVAPRRLGVSPTIERRSDSSLLSVFSRTTVLRHEARSLSSVSSSAEDRCSLFFFFFSKYKITVAHLKGAAFPNSARGERLERKMGRNVLVLFHGDKCSAIIGLSRKIIFALENRRSPIRGKP